MSQKPSVRKIHQSVLQLPTADSRGVDFLVMGTWGYSRIREMILGGVTRQVLEQTTLPVLMAH